MTTAQTEKVSSLTPKIKRTHHYGRLIGKSPPMLKTYHLLDTIKACDSTVLITGETGTGKELIAHTIHYASTRNSSPMVAVNCAAIPKELMEREFFGNLKGAYTGAVSSKQGYFEAADGGTLFLDEIGEMDLGIQVKLLRVLERKEIIRVGDSSPTPIDVRLIAATNKDLQGEVRKGRFREDLFYRIYVIPIHLPPLRKRREDIPLLIDNFVRCFQSKSSKEIPPFTEKEMELLMNYPYSGNVRELENLIERYCLLGIRVNDLLHKCPKGAKSVCSDFPYDELLSSASPLKVVAQKARTRAERELINHVLQLCNNNYSEASKMLNISLSSLYRKVKESD